MGKCTKLIGGVVVGGVVAIPIGLLQAGSGAGAIGTTGSASESPSTTAASSPTTGTPAAVPHPIGIPVGPVSSLADCPLSPAMSSPLPAGAYVTGPTLSPSTLSYTDNGQTTDEGNLCEYGVHVNPDITIYNLPIGNRFAAEGTEYAGSFNNGLGSSCYFNYKVNTYDGYGWAGLELTSGSCAHGADYIYSNWSAVNGSLVNGTAEALGTFGGGLTYSDVSPSIFFGEYAICMEAPVGTPPANTYVCADVNYGPLF